jgi:hypothetical protein
LDKASKEGVEVDEKEDWGGRGAMRDAGVDGALNICVSIE